MKRLLCVSTIFVGLIFASLCFADIDPGTAGGIWLFDEGAGQVVGDISGNGNDGAVMGDAQWVQGNRGGALQFDDEDDFVEVQDADSLDAVNLSVVAWVRNILPTENVLLMKNEAYFWVMTVDGIPQANLFFDATWKGRWIATTALEDDTWAHIAFTYDAEKVRFYLNGVLDAEVDAPGPGLNVSDSFLRIAERTNPSGTGFDGTVDEFGVFTAVLTEADIVRIMSDGLAGALGITAVEPASKLATTWAEIRVR